MDFTPLLADSMRFETPGYLVLLATIPLLILLSFRSMAGLGPIRRVLAIGMRCAVVTAMVLALAGAQWVKTQDDLSVIFVVDRSSSVPRELQRNAFDFASRGEVGDAADQGSPRRNRVRRAQRGRTVADEHARDRPHQRSGRSGSHQPRGGAADRHGALHGAIRRGRVVVLSDGNENVGEALVEAEHFSAAGVPIDVVPLRYEHGNEVVFERLSSPPTATTDETVNLNMVLRSQREVSGKILVYQNRELVRSDDVVLEPGPNRRTLAVALPTAGPQRFEARFVPDAASDDTITGNNEGRAFTVVTGQGQVLLLHQASDAEAASARLLERALRAEQIRCELVEPGVVDLSDLATLSAYSAVILANVPSHLFSDAEREALAVYVRDLGGGLLMIGGDASFGAGGWLGTPVEDVMPVSFDVKSRKQIPKGALALIMHGCEIPEGNYWSERVAIAAVKSLSSRDLVGVLSFDWKSADQGHWDVPLQSVGDKSRVIQGIKKLAHGDMPHFDPLMRSAVDALAKRTDAAVRHMIILVRLRPAAAQAGCDRQG